MTVSNPRRPWYCPDPIIDAYVDTLTDGGNLRMLKALKIARSIVVNIGILVLSGYGISQGGDASLIVPLALLVLGGYNGLEFSDYMALLQAYKEVQDNS